MKEKELNTKKRSNTKSAPTKVLPNKVTAAAAQVEKSWEAYKQKIAEYENAVKQNVEKISLKQLLAAAKIARFTYKITCIEHKLAKAIWKAANKVDKKSSQASSKQASKHKAVKTTNHKAPKDNATKGKGSTTANKAEVEQKGKKNTAA